LVQRSPETQEIKETYSAFAFRIVTFYEETVLFALLVRKKTTNILNIATSAVPYTEEKYGLTLK